jgi:hypothetical protein
MIKRDAKEQAGKSPRSASAIPDDLSIPAFLDRRPA